MKATPANSEWKPKTGVVALLDFLGVSTFDIAKCGEFFERRRAVLNALHSMAKTVEAASVSAGIGGAPIGIRTFGDSILLTWSKDDVHSHDLLTVGEILKGVFHHSIWHGILVRGAVSVGEFIESDTPGDLAVLGPAIADVASWYEQADWSGIFATPRAGHLLEFRVRSCVAEKEFDPRLIERTFVAYDVPFKGFHKSLWCVAWPHFLSTLKLTDAQRAAAFYEQVSKFSSIPFGAESKYSNTLAFFDWYWKDVYPRVKGVIPSRSNSRK